MDEARGGKMFVPLTPQCYKLVLSHVIFDMPVFHLVGGNSDGWHGLAFPLGRVIMARPDLDVARQGQQLLGRLVQITRTSTGKITPGRANVDVEQ